MNTDRHTLRKKLGRLLAVLFASSLFLQVAFLPLHSFAQEQKVEKSILSNVDELDSQNLEDAPGKLPSFHSTAEFYSLQFIADARNQEQIPQIQHQPTKQKQSAYILFRALLL